MQPPRPPTRLERVTSHESACSQATPAPQRGSYTGHVISEASAPPSSLTHALDASYVVKARRPVFAADDDTGPHRRRPAARLRKPIPSAFARALPRRVSEPTPRLFDGAAASPGPHAKARRSLAAGAEIARPPRGQAPREEISDHRASQRPSWASRPGVKKFPQFRRRENLVGARGSTAGAQKFGPPPPCGKL